MKDKGKLKEQWRLTGDIERDGGNCWRSKTRHGEVKLLSTKKQDPYIGSRLAFWQWLTQENDFPGADLIRGKNGEHTLTVSQDIYYAVDRVKGGVIDFGNMKTVNSIGVLLGKFHSLAQNFDWHSHCLPQKRISRYLQRMEELLREGEKSCGNSFSLNKLWDILLVRAQRSFSLLCRGALEDMEERVLSQGTYVYGKIDRQGFVTVGEDVQLTDISHMAEDSSILDLWRLCRRYLSQCQSPEDVFSIIDSYERERKLDSTERKALYGFILFPYDELRFLTSNDKKEKAIKILKREEERAEFYKIIFEKERLGEDENSH